MNAPSGWYTFRTAIMVASLPVAGLLATIVNLKPSIELATQGLAYFVWAATLVGVRHQRALLLWERAKRYLLNTTCRWSFAARLVLPDAVAAAGVLDRVLRSVLGASGASLISREQLRALVHLDGTTLSVRLVSTHGGETADDSEHLELVVEVLETTTPYRHLRYFFEHRLDPIVEDARRVAGCSREKYELAFGFPADENPYFGMLVRRLRPDGEFRWSYSERTAQQGTLQITRDRLELATFSAAELRIYFRRFVGLALEAAPPR